MSHRSSRPPPSHSGSKWLKPAKNKFTQSDFTSFSIQIPAYSNSFRFRSLRVSYQKFVKSLQEQVWSVIFTNFLNLIFGGNFEFDPTVAKTFFTVLFLSFPGSLAQYEATTTLGFSRKERPRRRPHSLSIPLQSVHAQKSYNILWKCLGHKRWRRW